MASGGRPHHPDLRCGNRPAREAATRLAGGDSRPARRARARRGHGGAAGDRHRGGARARAAPPLVAGQRRPRRNARACRLEGSPGRLRAGAVSSTGLIAISEKARRWGILPAYHGWQGNVVETPPDVEQAILDAMGAAAGRPPRVRRPKLPDEPCAPAPERVWGWAVQLYALRSRESWGVGDFADLRHFARWSRRAGASAILLNPLGAQTPTLPYQPSPYYASTRRFRNILYLRVEEIEGADTVDLAALRDAARRLNDQRIIDYDEVFRLKSRALENIFGAPPDEFFRDGQDWGLPAFNPWRLGDARWEPFIDAIRGAAGHAAGVRLDHVMGLFRLFWIPDGMTAAQGAYVRYPAHVLLPLLANESRRAKAFVIGEDLGLVEPRVRKHLRRKGSLSYRLVWFEGSEPARWTHDAVAAVGTHDLPTVAGIWTRSEPEHRLHHLRDKLVSLTHLPDDTQPVDVAVAAYRQLARGRTRMVLVSMEDALGVHERPNVPGTTDEFPNWRIALPVPLEEIERADGMQRIAHEMKAAGR